MLQVLRRRVEPNVIVYGAAIGSCALGQLTWSFIVFVGRCSNAGRQRLLDLAKRVGLTGKDWNNSVLSLFGCLTRRTGRPRLFLGKLTSTSMVVNSAFCL